MVAEFRIGASVAYMRVHKPLGIRLEARPESVGIARRAVVDYAVAAGADGRASDVELAVSEAVTNAVRHGYPDQPGHVDISAAASADALTVVVIDDGEGLRVPSHDPGLGFGVQIMERLADEFTLEDTGHGVSVRMRFFL